MAKRGTFKAAKAAARGKAAEAEEDLEDGDEGREEAEGEDEDRSALRGGPGQEVLDDDDKAGKGGAAPKTVELVIGGKKFTVSQDLAETIQAQNIDPGTIRRLEDEITALKAPKKPPTAEDPEKDYEGLDDLMFTNPKEFAKRVRKLAVDEALGRATNAYVADKTWDLFWTRFHKDFPELKEAQWLSEQIMKEKQKELDPLSMSEGSKKLAAYTKERIGSLVKMAGGTPRTEKPKSRTLIEAGDGGGGRPARNEDSNNRQQPEEAGPRSLSDVLRLRRTERRNAASKMNKRR